MMVQNTYSLWKTESKVIFSNDDDEDCDRNEILRRIAAELIESKFIPEKLKPEIPEKEPSYTPDDCTLTDTIKNNQKVDHSRSQGVKRKRNCSACPERSGRPKRTQGIIPFN